MAEKTRPAFEEFINFNRFSNFSVLPLALYLPFGILLGLLRLFIFLHAGLLFYLLPDKFPLKRAILRVMLAVTGVPISVRGVPKVDNKKVMVANSVSSLDPFILALLCRNRMVIEEPVVKRRNPFFQPLLLPADANRDQVLLSLKNSACKHPDPLLFFPERLKTNGKVRLLKFNDLPFELDSPIQPVTIQTSRFLFDISVSTYDSSPVADVLWCLVLPFTLFTVKYLPVTERKVGESDRDFSIRVQTNMAKSMGIATSNTSHCDVVEYTKQLSSHDHDADHELPTPTSGTNSRSNVQVTQAQSSGEKVVESHDEEIKVMLKQVKVVFPDFLSEAIVADLKTTRDVDTTITNILEGRVTSTLPKVSQPLTPSIPSNVSFQAKKFESTAASRHLSFAERKQAMLDAARLRYKQKHGLV